jgi:hypothetical protein
MLWVKLLFDTDNKERGKQDASLLCEMSRKERNEGYPNDNNEEWQTSNERCLPSLWHQDVQNRKRLS